MTLRDAVKTASNNVGKQATDLSKIAADRSLEPSVRRAAFDQIIALEVGRTWMRRSKAIERDFGISELYLKFEGDNPTGTQKDRIAFAQVADALGRGQQEVALATCGNYGVAVALAAKLAGINCHVYIPADFHSERIEEMEALGAFIYRPKGSYEEVVELSSAEAVARNWYDANPGEMNAELQVEAYARIGKELREEMKVPAVCCAVPVSNGTLLAGIHRGLGNQLPTQMIAASSTAKNPIVYSFRKGFDVCVDLDPKKILETKINEPLINWHSFDGQIALDALHRSGGAAYNISDERMRKMASYLDKREALRVLPASTAGLIALIKRHEDGRLPAGPHVAILTAKR